MSSPTQNFGGIVPPLSPLGLRPWLTLIGRSHYITVGQTVGQTVCATVAQCEHYVQQLDRQFAQQFVQQSAVAFTPYATVAQTVGQTVTRSVHTMRRFDKLSVQLSLVRSHESNMFDTCH